VALVVALAFLQFPSALSAGLSYRRGKVAEGAGDFHTALARYEAAAIQYPDSTELVLRIAVAAYRDGDFAKSVRALSQIAGRKVDKSIASEADWLYSQLQPETETTEIDPRKSP
jgi:hypothetical protein